MVLNLVLAGRNCLVNSVGWLMCESMPGVFLGIVLKNGKGTMMRETVLSRAAFVAAAGTALLTLVGCGGQRTQDATGFNDDRPVKDRM